MATKRKDPEEAEKCLIGSILSNPKRYLDPCLDSGLTVEAFMPSRPAALVFAAMMELRSAKKSMDMVSIIELMDAGEELRKAGGAEAINEVLTFVPTGANYDTYLELVLKNAAVRHAGYEMDKIKTEISSAKYKEDVLSVLSNAFKMPMSFLTGGASSSTERELLLEYMDTLENSAKNNSTPVFSTPFPTINNKAGGTCDGEVTGVLGKPSVGKSILGKQMLLHNLLAHGMPSLVLTAEMPYQQWMNRLVCEMGEINYKNLRLGRMTDIERGSLISVITKISKLPLFVYDRKRVRFTKDAIEAVIRREAKQNGVKCVLIDYLQKVEVPHSKNKKDLRTDQEIGEVSNMLKEMAVTYGLHIIALCSESDDGNVRNSREPEYDFDNLLRLIARTDKHKVSGDPIIVTDKMVVGKWRDAERGYTVRVEMEGAFCRFKDVTGPNA